MRSAGKIYIGETICDACSERLDSLFGQGEWFLIEDSPWHSLDTLPDRMTIGVKDMTSRKQIATLSVDNEFYVEDMGFHRQIAVRPANIQIIVKVE